GDCRGLAGEAAGRHVALLEAAVAANGFSQVRVVHAAASDRRGIIAFGPHLAWGHVRKMTEDDDVPRVGVDALPIDELVREAGWNGLDVVKLNVEGWEPDGLSGMKGMFGRPGEPDLLFSANTTTRGG